MEKNKSTLVRFFAALLLAIASVQIFCSSAEAAPTKAHRVVKAKTAASSTTTLPPVEKPLIIPPMSTGPVIIVPMKMAILPGTEMLLKRALEEAVTQKAQALLVELDTPGGLINVSQAMLQDILKSEIPVIVYVGPSGSMAASAGMFITVASHLAVMAPGTSIGAAHPVSGDGKNIETDMRAKAENIAVAMVTGVASERGRNVAWVEKAIRESVAATNDEALKLKVIDLIAASREELFSKVSGRTIVLNKDRSVVLGDLSLAARVEIMPSSQESFMNFIADPTIASLLWMAATTSIAVELYNPGAIVPLVVGVICLCLALMASQALPLSYGALALLVAGALMIGFELVVPSGILGLGGIIALALGALYLFDPAMMPGLEVSSLLIISIAAVFGGALLSLVYFVVRATRQKVTTGGEGLIGAAGRATTVIERTGKVSVLGEMWSAQSVEGVIEKDTIVEVVSREPGMILRVKKSS